MFELEKNWTLEQLQHFDDILDVRSPAEYAHDHLPLAHNFPVLDDEERARVGLLYKTASTFAAKKHGAALVAEHIAAHLKEQFADKAEGWQPLVYCWRGGTRSAAMTHVLKQIGWRAQQLPGGYKAYRRRVIEKIAALAPQLRFRVLCGRTGVGKTQLLKALQSRAAQVLDLEALANHRGSVLGESSAGEQPSQKGFESQLCAAMSRLDPQRVVYVEAESSKIGRIQIPRALLAAMHRGHCIQVAAPLPSRVAFLCSEYDHFLQDGELFATAIARLSAYVGKQKIADWLALHRAGKMSELVEDLLVSHYDPFYLRSMKKHFQHYQNTATTLWLDNIDEQTIARAIPAML